MQDLERIPASATKVKICRVQTLVDARNCIWLGSDYLGFHVLSEEEIGRADHWAYAINRSLISKEGFDGGVLLTRCLDIPLILEAMERGAFKNLQIHAIAPNDFWKELRCSADRLGFSILGLIDPSRTDPEYWEIVARNVDHPLYDHLRGGTGSPVLVPDLPVVDLARAFIAGGINAENVEDRLATYSPFGVDVQTGSEGPVRTKNYPAIVDLMTRVKPGRPRISTREDSFIVNLAVHGQQLEAVRRAASSADMIHVDVGLDDSIDPHLREFGNQFSSQLIEVHLFHLPSLLPKIRDLLDRWPGNVVECIIQIDSSEIQSTGPAPYRQLTDALARGGIRAGLAINAIASALGLQQPVRDLLHDERIRHVNLMLPPIGGELDRESVVEALRGVREVNPVATIGVDRGVSLERLQALADLPIRRAVVGTAAISSADPHGYIATLRSELEGPGRRGLV